MLDRNTTGYISTIPSICTEPGQSTSGGVESIATIGDKIYVTDFIALASLQPCSNPFNPLAAHLDQLMGNLGVAGVRLTEDVMFQLNKISD